MVKQATRLIPGVACIALFSCTVAGKQESSKAGPPAIAMTTSPETAKWEPREKGVELNGVVMVASESIMSNTSKARDLATLTTMLKTAQLDSILAGKGSYTLFAADNGAFNELPEGRIETLLKPGYREMLRNMLAYHIVKGRYASSDLEHGMVLTTLQGGKIRVRHKDHLWWINNAKVLVPGIPSSNGTIWIINKVLTRG